MRQGFRVKWETPSGHQDVKCIKLIVARLLWADGGRSELSGIAWSLLWAAIVKGGFFFFKKKSDSRVILQAVRDNGVVFRGDKTFQPNSSARPAVPAPVRAATPLALTRRRAPCRYMLNLQRRVAADGER